MTFNTAYNAAFIADLFLTDMRHENWVETNQKELNGSTGIYEFIAHLATYMDRCEKKINWEKHGLLYECVVITWIDNIYLKNTMDYETELNALLKPNI